MRVSKADEIKMNRSEIIMSATLELSNELKVICEPLPLTEKRLGDIEYYILRQLYTSSAAVTLILMTCDAKVR
jgi:hypothetical protein